MGSIHVGDSDFSLSQARFMLINSPFTFITEQKIQHLYSLITTHDDFHVLILAVCRTPATYELS